MNETLETLEKSLGIELPSENKPEIIEQVEVVEPVVEEKKSSSGISLSEILSIKNKLKKSEE